tara:strand:- start:2502 stop:2840 length:339 start_codon:yes stop_codon:yes gene_type:complete
MAVQFNKETKKNIYLTKKETLGLPAVYIDGIRVTYFHYLVENYIGSSTVNFEPYYHFIKDKNTLHVRVHYEERESIWWWDADIKNNRTYYYEFLIDPSKEEPFIMKAFLQIN